MHEDPKIVVSRLRLNSHRCKPNGVAAWASLTIIGTSGIVREWKNVRLVFDGFFDIDFPIGRYVLLVEGQYSNRTHRRGTRLIPPSWRRAAKWAAYDAAVEAEVVQKKQEAEEIAAGTRWAPLPMDMITPRKSTRKESAW